MVLVTDDQLRSSLAFALRDMIAVKPKHDADAKDRALQIAAGKVAAHLRLCGYVLMRAPLKAHSAPPKS